MRVLKNTLGVFAGDAGSRFLGFLITVYLARILSPASFGLFNMGLAILGHLALVASPGIGIIESRNAAADRFPLERMQTILGLRVFTALLLCLGTVLVSMVAVTDPLQRVVFALSSLSLIPMALWIDWFFQGKEEGGTVALGRVLQYVCYGLACLLLVRRRADAGAAAVAFYIGVMAGAILLLQRYRRRYGPVRFLWNPAEWKQILRDNLPAGTAVFFGQLVINLPPLAAGFLLSLEASGMWSAAMKLVFLVLAADRILNIVLLPLATRILPQPGGKRVLRTWLAGVLVLAPFGAACGAAFALPAVTLVFGNGYASAAPVLQILMIYATLTVMNSVAVCVLLAAGLEKVYAVRLIFGSAVLSLAVLVLTPLAGLPGTAWAVVIGEAFTVVLTGVVALRVIGPLPSTLLVRWLVAVGSGCAAAFSVPGGGTIGALTGAVVFLALTLSLGVFTRGDFRTLKGGLA